jgi:alpha-amylase/alpha-mannosidase (GH57 family)
MKPYICIHGHFYQPPRENPWLGEVEIQDSAYPFHDWNQRISAECYAPNSAARILDEKNDIVDIINNYAKLSFNFGPTLLSWLEKHEPEIYSAILEADKQSQKRFSGHGSAIAQAYNHIIMPLANSRDKHTQIYWGIQDFSHRFKRKPEGMWLPETAVDTDTLEIMAQLGIKFTILSPGQVNRVRKIGSGNWIEVKGGKVDPKKPYSVPLPSGKRLAIFFYDGSISHDIAFGDLLKNGEIFAQRLLQPFSREQVEAQIVHIATDGESYGHHHRFGDMALAYGLDKIESDDKASLTVYGEYLERHPPEYEVEIAENSSWSCAHGVERWRNDCGCHTGLNPGSTQAWRAPLREAMDWLKDKVISLYKNEMVRFVRDIWAVRNEYIHVVLNRSENNVGSFFSMNFGSDLTKTEKTKVLKLLELQRNAMFMFTSCGWFFDDISGIESVQVMKYAGRVIQLAKEIEDLDLEAGYLERLERAPSNKPAFSNGAKIYEQFVEPAELDLLKIGVHYAVSSLFETYPETIRIGEYTAQNQSHDILESTQQKLVLGKAKIRSDVLWEEESISYAVLHLGQHNLYGGARPFTDDHAFSQMGIEIKEAFQKEGITQVVRSMDKHFGDHNYTLWHLLKDKKREILNQVLESTLIEAETSLHHIFDKHHSIMFALKKNNVPLPKAFSTSVEFILNADFRKLMEAEELDIDGIKKIVDEFAKWTLQPDKALLGFVSSSKIDTMMLELQTDPEKTALLKTIDSLMEILGDFPLDLNLWKSQNIFFTLCNKMYGEMKEKANTGDKRAEEWILSMESIGRRLNVKCF